MSIHGNLRGLCLGLALATFVAGCSGGGDAPASPTNQPAATASPAATAAATPAPDASATPGATPGATGSPSAELTPEPGISPLGGRVLSETEKEYFNKKEKAKDLALAKNYEAALPILDELHAHDPEDVDVMFYLLLSHGSSEEIPKKKSKAYEFAEKLLKAAPDSREAGKARSYINSANLSIPDKFKYGDDTMDLRGNWVLAEESTYKIASEAPLHTEMQARGLSPGDQAILWETEASPATNPVTDKLPKGTEVKVMGVKDYLYGLTSWRKKLDAKPKLDTTIFDVTAMYVEVTSEGPLKGKKGWIVNHVDRYLGSSEEGDVWGSWISNRLQIPRETDLETPTPKR